MDEEIVLNDFKTLLSSWLLSRLLKYIFIGSIIEYSIPSSALIYFAAPPSSNVSKYNFAVTFWSLLDAPTFNQSIWKSRQYIYDAKAIVFQLLIFIDMMRGARSRITVFTSAQTSSLLLLLLLLLSITSSESRSLTKSLTTCFLTTKLLCSSSRCTLRYQTLEPLPFSPFCISCRISSLEEWTATRGLYFKLLSVNLLFRVDKLTWKSWTWFKSSTLSK